MRKEILLLLVGILFLGSQALAEINKCDRHAIKRSLKLHGEFRVNPNFESLKYLGTINTGRFADSLFKKDVLKAYAISNTEGGGAGLWLVVANASKHCRIVTAKLLMEDDD